MFPNIQPEPHWAQLIISSYCCYLGEEANPHLTTASFQAVVESNKVSPEPPLPQTEQSQFLQPFPIRPFTASLPFSEHSPAPQCLAVKVSQTVLKVQPYQNRNRRGWHSSKEPLGRLHSPQLGVRCRTAVGRTQSAKLCDRSASPGTYTLWRTHQPQWGSREPRHSSQLSYCSQLSTGTRVTCGKRQ